MSTQAIGSGGYTDAYSLLRAANEEEQLVAQAKKVSQEAGKNGTSAMGKDIMSYLSKVPKGSDGRLSFKDVEDHRKKLELDWDTAVMADLEKLGVDISKELPLTYDPATGKVTVSSTNKDKAVIDKYFEDNPDKVTGFNEILQLGKLTSTADANLSQQNMMTSLRQESLAWWYEDNSDPTSWFDGGGMVKGLNASAYQGLNLTV